MSKAVFQFCLSGLLMLFGLGFSGLSAIATTSLNVTVQADQVHSYGRLMEQVVSAANDAIANTFKTNPNIDPIKLTVLINRNGQVLPILIAEISRAEWQQQPDVQNWARYSTSVRTLLGYAQPTRTATRPEPYSHQAFFEREALIDQLD